MSEGNSNDDCQPDNEAVEESQLEEEQQQQQQQVLSTEDWNDAYLAHQYRLSLPSSPSQSNFRVLALLFYEELLENKDGTSTTTAGAAISHLPPWVKQVVGDRTFIVGTNDEPGYMGGAICAERAAMVQLRFVPAFRITKLVIATDCETVPISPGMLCREFLAGHGDSVPWDLKVISTGSQCSRCKQKDEAIFNKMTRIKTKTSEETSDTEKSTLCCIDGHVEHSLPTLQTTIAELYTFPSPYTRLTAPQSVALGIKYSESPNSNSDLDALDVTAKRLLELAILEAKQSVSNEIQAENHPIHFGAAVVFEDQSISTSHQSSALEYGCSLDAVSQLAPYIQDEACAPVLIVQVDQYGVAHSPFAPARAFLSEHGYEECHVLVHDTATCIDDVTRLDQWELKEVRVADLAPTPPAWTTSTSISTSTTSVEEDDVTDDDEKDGEDDAVADIMREENNDSLASETPTTVSSENDQAIQSTNDSLS